MFLLLLVLIVVSTSSLAATISGNIDFQRQVRPILSDNCFLCHGPDKGTRMVDLRLDVQEGAFAARKNGTPIVPGKPNESLVIKRIYSDNPAFRMPPVFAHKTLTKEQKDTLRRWIEQGANWTQHWAFVPPKKAAPPEVKMTAWPRNDVDRFILAKLEGNGLSPAPEADRRTLIRRVTLDLTGLPPTPAEVDAFVKDKSPKAYEKVVNRLLASPHYGEHRARYWLDAARYADTNGWHFDNYREIWPYRDWIINSLNQNMPFDRFTVEQLAGDLLPQATLDQKIASGFQRCNLTTDEGGAILPEVEAMSAKDRADTTGTVWMGLTVGCATCHDHKFDPISQKDYYSLTSFFRNTTQPVMDLNIQDTPPAILVPPVAEREKWKQLTAQRGALNEKLAAEHDRAVEHISTWVDGIRTKAVSFAPESQVMALQVSGQVSVSTGSDAQRVEIPAEVEIAEGPSGETDALRFKKGGKVTLPAVPAIDSDKAFTISAWIFIPNSKENGTVASQYEMIPDAKSKDRKRRGWALKIDRGNVGRDVQAPTIYCSGVYGKGISWRPAPEYKFKPDSWYHLVVSYD